VLHVCKFVNLSISDSNVVVDVAVAVDKIGSDNCSSDSSGKVEEEHSDGSYGRLAGGGISSSSVSDTDTLVGEESQCRLACKH